MVKFGLEYGNFGVKLIKTDLTTCCKSTWDVEDRPERER